MQNEEKQTDSDCCCCGRKRKCIPLHETKEGRLYVINEVCGGREFSHRLAEMGLVPNEPFMIESNPNHGPMVVVVKGTRLVLGHGTLERILVEPYI